MDQVGAPVDALAAWKSTSFSSAAVRWYTWRALMGLQTDMGSPPQTVWDVESTNEPAMLQVNLPRTTHRDKTMATFQWSLIPIFSPHSVTECPSDTVTRPNMEEEVERLLSSTLSNMPEQSCAPVSPRKPPPMVPNAPAASKEKAPPDLGEIIP